jgi:hypothetical protein
MRQARGRSSLFIAGTTIVLVAGLVSAQAWVLAKVNFYMGEVGYSKAQSEEWSDVVLQQSLFAGDAVRTGAESRLELKTSDDGLVVRIDENSELEISTRSLQEWKGPGTRATARRGRLWTNVRRMAADRENLTVETPTVLAAVRGTIFRIDIPSDSTTILRVYEGQMEVRDNPAPPPPTGELREVAAPREIAAPREVSAQQWLELVSANEQLVVTRGLTPVKSEFDPAEDAQLDWVQWNQARDRELERTPPPEAPKTPKRRKM